MANRAQSTLGGAATGAAAGSAFGPWGTAIGGAAGGIIGFFSGGAEEEAERKKRRAMSAAAGRYRDQRPHLQQGRLNAMANRLSAYQPANYALGTMYGAPATMSPDNLLRNPFTGQGPVSAPVTPPIPRSPELIAHGAGGADPPAQSAASRASAEAGARFAAEEERRRQAANAHGAGGGQAAASRAASAASRAAGRAASPSVWGANLGDFFRRKV